jgi:hypothetical protein
VGGASDLSESSVHGSAVEILLNEGVRWVLIWAIHRKNGQTGSGGGGIGGFSRRGLQLRDLWKEGILTEVLAGIGGVGYKLATRRRTCGTSTAGGS